MRTTTTGSGVNARLGGERRRRSKAWILGPGIQLVLLGKTGDAGAGEPETGEPAHAHQAPALVGDAVERAARSLLQVTGSSLGPSCRRSKALETTEVRLPRGATAPCRGRVDIQRRPSKLQLTRLQQASREAKATLIFQYETYSDSTRESLDYPFYAVMTEPRRRACAGPACCCRRHPPLGTEQEES